MVRVSMKTRIGAMELFRSPLYPWCVAERMNVRNV
jgi:hypothetical protein